MSANSFTLGNIACAQRELDRAVDTLGLVLQAPSKSYVDNDIVRAIAWIRGAQKRLSDAVLLDEAGAEIEARGGKVA